MPEDESPSIVQTPPPSPLHRECLQAVRFIVPGAIVIAGALIGASIVGAVWESHYLEGRYELVTSSGSDSGLGWRLNKHTGVVVPCELAKSSDPFLDMPPLRGSPPVRPVDRIEVECGRE
jgi:hypothetical protein